MESVYKTDIVALKKRMIDRGIRTIGMLSEMTGVNRNLLSNVLNGGIQPSTYVMDQLVLTLGILPEEAGNIFFNKNLRIK